MLRFAAGFAGVSAVLGAITGGIMYYKKESLDKLVNTPILPEMPIQKLPIPKQDEKAAMLYDDDETIDDFLSLDNWRIWKPSFWLDPIMIFLEYDVGPNTSVFHKNRMESMGLTTHEHDRYSAQQEADEAAEKVKHSH